MAFVTDSRFRGYIAPRTGPLDPQPLLDDAWTDFLQEMVVGVTGLDPRLVWPRWQPEPPPIPNINVNWAAIGITRTRPDWGAAIIHISDNANGFDAFQRQEHVTLLCTFYGPRNGYFGMMLRDGLYIDQNRAILRANAIGIIEVGDVNHVPELFRERYRDRVDINVELRREIRHNYPVLNLLRAQAHITAKAPYSSDRVIEDDVDTGPSPTPVTTDFILGPGPAGTVLQAGPASALGVGQVTA